MVEMHLLSVNVDFRYNPIYALGVVTSFERFMQGYRPERDKDPIFQALIKAVGYDPQQYKQDAQQLESLAVRLSGKELVSWLTSTTPTQEASELHTATVEAVVNNPQFKYSRLFAIGLFTLIELADSDLVKDEKQRVEILKQVCSTLHLPEDKFQKDLDLYRGNLEKMAQVLAIIEDTQKTDQKKRDQADQNKDDLVAPPNSSSEPSQPPGTPQDESSTGS